MTISPNVGRYSLISASEPEKRAIITANLELKALAGRWLIKRVARQTARELERQLDLEVGRLGAT